MKVVCIDNISDFVSILGKPTEHHPDGSTYLLTIGKTYHVIIDDVFEDSYFIKNDKGDGCIYSRRLFKLLDEVREQKLNELGI